MLTWRNVLLACLVTAYLAWSANNLWHDFHDAPADAEPVAAPVLIEMV